MIGEVTSYDKKTIRGWAKPKADGTPQSVTMKVNGKSVMKSIALQPFQREEEGAVEPIGFRFNTRKMYRWVGQGDKLEIYVGKTALPILPRAGATSLTVSSRIKSRTKAVFRRMRTLGYTLDKYGQPRKPLIEAKTWQKEIFTLYNRLRVDVREILGVDLWMAFGTLLGCVRGNDFISWDNDFDSMYISKLSGAKEIKAEYKKLCRGLQAKGYALRVLSDHVQVHLGEKRSNTRAKLDIFYSWFNADKTYEIAHGYHGEKAQYHPDFYEEIPAKMAGRNVMIPKAFEAILNQTYGLNWRTPDPGFSFMSETRKRDKKYAITRFEANEFHWQYFYSFARVKDPSLFAQKLAGKLAPNTRILDLGTGNGRDAVFFAKEGHRVLGVDMSEKGIEAAKAWAKRSGVTLDLRRMDVRNAERFATLIEALPPENDADPLLVYMRFFLQAMSIKGENNVLGHVRKQLKPGDKLAIEFRAEADRGRKKAHKFHARRYYEPKALAKKLDALGFDVIEQEDGPNFSPYKEEKAYLGRIIAVKRDPKAAA